LDQFGFYYIDSFTSVSVDWKVRYPGFLIPVELSLKKYLRLSDYGSRFDFEVRDIIVCRCTVPYTSTELRFVIAFGAFLLWLSPPISSFLSSLSSYLTSQFSRYSLISHPFYSVSDFLYLQAFTTSFSPFYIWQVKCNVRVFIAAI